MQRQLFHPRFWGTWCGVALFWLLSRLPFKIQLAIGRWMGHWGLKLLKRRKSIAQINLKLVFPDLSTDQVNDLLRQHFESIGMSIFESTLGWWGNRKKLISTMQISGLEHLDQAIERGNGVLLFSAHFTTLDLSGIMLATQRPIHAVYRPNENPVLDHIIKQGRERTLVSTIPRGNIREMVRHLKNNQVVWYAMDQNFGHKGSLFSTFFGIPAATNTATSRLVKMTGAAVIPFFAHRLTTGQYQLSLLPPVDMDGSAPQQETDHLNLLIEKAIQEAPEQYLWIHRRFKDRPGQQSSFYPSP